MRPHVTGRPATAIAAALALAACGGAGGVASSGTAAPPTPAPSPSPTSSPAPVVSATNSAEYRASGAAVLAEAAAALDRGITGRGVTIAVIDSGVARSSPEFAGRISADSTGFAQTIARCGTCPPETIAPYPIDDRLGHGSAVAAVALAARDGAGLLGVAPEATLLALKIIAPDLSARGTTLPEGSAPNAFLIPTALRYAVAKDAFVSVLALDGATTGPLTADLHDAMGAVRGADRLVVQAVPNSDDGVSNGIAQALVGDDRDNARWFLYAIALDAGGVPRAGNGTPDTLADRTLAAAGNGVRALDADGAVVTISGNSFAAPAVAGAAALLRHYWPRLGGAAISQILLDTADDRGAPGVDQIYGAGVLDVARAMQAQAPASAFAAAQRVLARFAATSPSGPFGGAPDLARRVGAMTVVDRYGRDFVLHGAVVRSSAGGLRVGGLAAPWLPDAPATGAWAGFMPMRPAAIAVGQRVAIAANVSINGGEGIRGGTLREPGMTGFTAAWAGNGWSAALAGGRAPHGRAELRRVSFTSPLGLGAQLALLDERTQLLGARIGAAGGRTMLMTLSGARTIAGIAWTAQLTASRTVPRGGSALLRLDRPLTGSAFALEGSRPLFGGRATIAVSSSLRLDRASGLATVPLSFDLISRTLTEGVRRVDLTPRAREGNLEVGWSARVGTRAAVRLGVAQAFDAGHVAGAIETAGFVSIAVH